MRESERVSEIVYGKREKREERERETRLEKKIRIEQER